MRAIRRTIEGVTYDTGAARLVRRAWESSASGGGGAELLLYRGEAGQWFELRREQGQLYGALRPLSAAEAALWLTQHGRYASVALLARDEAGAQQYAPRSSAFAPLGG